MSISTLYHAALVLLLASLFAGCSTSNTFSAYNPRQHADVIPEQLALLEVPAALEVVFVDGYEPRISGLHYGPIQLQFLPGKHEITVEYEQLFPAEHSEGHTTIRSNPVTLNANMEAGGRYRLGFPPPVGVLEALDFARAPVIWVDDLAGGERQENYVDAMAHQGSLESPAERLQFWWKKADAKTRSEFLDWSRLYNDPAAQ